MPVLTQAIPTGDLTELCRWTVDLAALPKFHQIAEENGGGYIEFDLGLQLDSAEVRGVLMTEDGVECGAASASDSLFSAMSSSLANSSYPSHSLRIPRRLAWRISLPPPYIFALVVKSPALWIDGTRSSVVTQGFANRSSLAGDALHSEASCEGLVWSNRLTFLVR